MNALWVPNELPFLETIQCTRRNRYKLLR